MTNDFQFGDPFFRSFPIFWNETSSRIEIPELAGGYAKDVSIDDIKGEDGSIKRAEDSLDKILFIDGFGKTIMTVFLYQSEFKRTVG